MQLNERVASLDAPLDVDPTLSLGEAIADDNATCRTKCCSSRKSRTTSMNG